MDITIDLDDSDSDEQDTKRQRTDGAAPTTAAVSAASAVSAAAAVSTALPAAAPPWAVGDRVEAQWGTDDDEKWWLGKIAAVNSDGSLDVRYDDKDFEKAKPPHRVRPPGQVTEADGMSLYLSSSNATGYTGVIPDNNRFKAQRRVDGKTVHLGMFDTAVEAAVA